jgi:hypothetical protein
MPDQTVIPETVAPETPAEVSPAPTATPAEHMIPKARLDEEIARRKEFEVQIKALSKQQAEGSEAKKKLDEMTTEFQKMEKRSAFFEFASMPEIQCRNVKAAWLLCEAGDFFDKKGNPDFIALKDAAPEFFGQPTSNANAGVGTAQPPRPAQNMNNFIRRAAGRS